MSLIEQAREWVGDMLQGAGSSLRGQRAQSMFRIPSSFLPSNLQNGHRSAPDAVTYGVDSPNFNRLKQYCLRAFGGYEYNRTTDAEEVDVPNSSKSFTRDAIQNNAGTHSIRYGISMTSLEEVIDNGSTSRKSEKVETHTISRKSTGNGSTLSHRNPVPPYSTDSGVNIDFTELSGLQQTRSSEFITSSHKDNDEKFSKLHHQIRADKENDDAGRMILQESKEEETETGETGSEIYSVPSEKLSNIKIQNKTIDSSKNKCIEKTRLLSCCLRPKKTKKHTGSIRLSGKYKPTVSGNVTLGLQHFETSRQLRVILRSVESSIEHGRKMLCKVNLTGNSLSQIQRTQQFRSNSGNVDINETFYMDLKMDDLNGCVLKVQLRTLSKFVQRQSKVGVAYVPLENLDLMLNTTISVKLRDSVSSRQDPAEDDLEIISENRSIHAEVTALLQESDHPDIRYLRERRHQSLPQINYGCVSVCRPRRTRTLESKIYTTCYRQEL